MSSSQGIAKRRSSLSRQPAVAYVSRPPSGQMDLLTGTVPTYTGYSAGTSTSYAPSYSSSSTSTSYSSYLPAREETLSRHSFLGLPAQRQRPHYEAPPQKVRYEVAFRCPVSGLVQIVENDSGIKLGRSSTRNTLRPHSIRSGRLSTPLSPSPFPLECELPPCEIAIKTPSFFGSCTVNSLSCPFLEGESARDTVVFNWYVILAGVVPQCD